MKTETVFYITARWKMMLLTTSPFYGHPWPIGEVKEINGNIDVTSKQEPCRGGGAAD